jgi:hypothetical protein
MLVSTPSWADLEVYRSVVDFEAQSPKVYEGFEYADQSGLYNDVSLTFKNKATGEKIKLECKEIWGFRYKDVLFRIVKQGKYWFKNQENFPVALMGAAKSGPFHWMVSNDLVRQIHKGEKQITLNPFYTSFITATPTGELLLAPIDDLGDGVTKKLMEVTRQFMKDHPELQGFFNCMREKTSSHEKKKDVFRYYVVGNCLFWDKE